MANQMKFSGKVTAISEPLIGENGKWQSVMVVVTEDKEFENFQNYYKQFNF